MRILRYYFHELISSQSVIVLSWFRLNK